MKVENLLVSMVLLIVCNRSTLGRIRPAMPKEVYERLVRNGATSLRGSLKKEACRYFSRCLSCRLARKNRKALNQLSHLLIRRNIIPIQHENIDLNAQRWDASVNHRKTQSKSLRRFRRSIPGNPCSRKYAYPMIHFYGVDVLEKQVVEILQNPVNEEYQSFFTYACDRRAFSGMLCEPADMEYMAAVFVDDSQVAFRRISIPTTCTLTVGTYG